MLAVFQQSRFASYFLKVREVIVFRRPWGGSCISQSGSAASPGAGLADRAGIRRGNLYNNGPHPVDQALTLLNSDGMPDIFCKMDRANTFGDAEDYVKARPDRAGQALIDVEISSSDAYPARCNNVQGTRGGSRAA